ncbi:hypothetical protein [Streptodolium elevatio]|uniref:Uncharacterized protein n=1 Tax=Streptodolium elevatio TaxID=3157996 RepID=A0ABV3DK17_9ACTN
MTGPIAPPWVDDLFPFATPPALRVLIDVAWQHAYDTLLETEVYDRTLVESHCDFMFDLVAAPRPYNGWEQYPPPDEDDRRLPVPLYATPEFVPFGALGTGAYVGWLVPAPELGRTDHPVALASGHEHGVTFIGPDTRSGLEFMLSWALRRLRQHDAPPTTRRELVGRLAEELHVRPDPDRVYPGSSWHGSGVTRDDEFEIVFDVPQGWRNEPGYDGIGVLAPAAAFDVGEPFAPGDEPSLAETLAAARRALAAGHPATALLVLMDAFVTSPTCHFAELKPLWARAYRDLGRAAYAERLDRMAADYPNSCACPAPH